MVEAKPSASAWTLYVPGSNCAKSYEPLASAVSSRL